MHLQPKELIQCHYIIYKEWWFTCDSYQLQSALEHEETLGRDCFISEDYRWLLFSNSNENIVWLMSEFITRGQSLLCQNHEIRSGKENHICFLCVHPLFCYNHMEKMETQLHPWTLQPSMFLYFILFFICTTGCWMWRSRGLQHSL